MATATHSHPRTAKDALAAYLAQAGPINWNGGQRLTLSAGVTAQCSALDKGQIYALFFYNSAANDNNATVTVTWSNSQPPVNVTVPGTTGGQGLASLFLVSGDDTTTVSASISTSQPNAFVDTWIGSVRMPTNTTGLTNLPLPINGVPQPFYGYRRYYAVPPSAWQQLIIQSKITQFISVQFQENFATVNIVNATSQAPQLVTAVGTAQKQFAINTVQNQTLSVFLQGNGTQWVWMNADSQQDSQFATISLQPV